MIDRTQFSKFGKIFLVIGVAAGLAACSGAFEAPDGTPAFKAKPRFLSGGEQGVMAHTAVVAEGATGQSLHDAARAFCLEQRYSICRVMAWRDETQLPSTRPLVQSERDSMVFNYGINRKKDREGSLYDCDLYKPPVSGCLRETAAERAQRMGAGPAD